MATARKFLEVYPQQRVVWYVTPEDDAVPEDPVDWGDIAGKPSTFPPSVHTHDGMLTEAQVDAKFLPYDEMLHWLNVEIERFAWFMRYRG